MRPGVTTFELDSTGGRIDLQEGREARPSRAIGRATCHIPRPCACRSTGDRPRHPVEPEIEAGRYRRAWISAWYMMASMAMRRVPLRSVRFRKVPNSSYGGDARSTLSGIEQCARRQSDQRYRPRRATQRRRCRIFGGRGFRGPRHRADACMRIRRCRIIFGAGCRIRACKAGMVLAIEPMVNEGTARAAKSLMTAGRRSPRTVSYRPISNIRSRSPTTARKF